MPGNPFRNRTVWNDERAIPKPKTFRYPTLRELVAKLPCMKCGRHGRTQAAHANQGKGQAIKSSDATIFAACDECHADIDQPGPRAMPKEERRALEERLNLMTLRALVERGFLVVGRQPENDVGS